MRDMDIQHPDITSAELTGFPIRFPPIPDRRTVERAFILAAKDEFLEYCMENRDLVEDYIADNRRDYQDFQWEVYREVAY